MSLTLSGRTPLRAAILVGALGVGSCSAKPSASAPAPIAAPAAASTAAATPVAGGDSAARAQAVTPVHTPEQELAGFRLPEGYRAELVAAEPLVQDPVAVDFDADGRMYVVEMRGYMPNIQGKGEDQPVGRIVVVEDTNDDGRMDRKTIFMDSLVLPRAVKVLEHGVLVAATPNLWLARDTNGDLRADTRELVRDDYGTTRSNPEHNANGLLWGIDNWIHNANYGGQFRVDSAGRIIFRRAAESGQWGVSMDDYGRMYRNSNEDPLRGELIPSHYAMRNPALATMRGVHEQLTRNVPVWPAHKTPAVNRGYRPETMRPDSSLAHYTAAGSPTAYVGDRLPAELRSSVFVTEPAGNLVGRFIVRDEPDGSRTARTAYERAEFLTATDERFRPVNLATAPDGSLYVVDMYRGIIQHRTYITGYLEQQIVSRGMEQPIGLGRIWRITHGSATRGPKPQLSRRSPAELVPVLSHASGWWRITAQRLLVERGDRSVAPALRTMLRTSTDDRARLHALWTLDGLGAADAATIGLALRDASPHLRAAAARIAEPSLARGDASLTAAIVRLVGDSAAIVRRQAAASLGELPIARRDPVLLDLGARIGDDPIVADLVVSAVAGRELPFLERLLGAGARAGERSAATVQALSTVVLASRKPADVQRLVTLAGDEALPRWQRLALLSGGRVAGGGRAFGPPGGGGGQGGPGGGGQARGPLVELTAPPTGLLAATASSDSALREQAVRIGQTLGWPGKVRTATAPPARPLTDVERARFAAGEQQYAGSCAGCHQAGGIGLAGVAKPLVGSPWVLGPPVRLIRIVMHGKEGQMLMPPLGGSMTDEQMASVLTYVRRAWGNAATPISPSEINETRGATMGRNRPWTEAELSTVNR